MSVSLKKSESPYRGWQRCMTIETSELELKIPLEVGPRIIGCSYKGSGNLFYEFADQVGKSGSDEWRVYGGHRCWVAPESKELTYRPDNVEISVTDRENEVTLSGTPDVQGLRKEISLRFHSTNRLELTHKIHNEGSTTLDCAPWAPTIMEADSVGFLPLPARASHDDALQPTGSVTLWGYTNPADTRLHWGSSMIVVTQDRKLQSPCKVGMRYNNQPTTWVACLLQGVLMVKSFTLTPNATYPDLGSATEIFTNHELLEIETLGTMVTLRPGQTVSHTESWTFATCTESAKDPAGLKKISDLIESLLQH